ncbi:MAG: nitrous oxide reductase accessory protein NosL [Nitrospirota bacterium]
MIRSLFPLFLSLVLIIAMAAAGRADDKVKPSICSVCNMKISETERKFSVVLPNAEGMGPASYDDIGCAVMSRNGECATRQSFFDGIAIVFDFVTGEQVPAEKAFFAFKSSFRTPMGYGIVAFRDKAQAEKFAAEHGKVKVVKWFELVDMKL